AAVIDHTAFIGGGADQNFTYSNAWYSYTPPGDMPPAVTLVAPADMSTLTTPAVTFQWQSVSKSESYRLEISTSSSFSALLIDSTLMNANSDMISTLTAGQYYWRVAAVSGIEIGTWSPVRSFTIAQAGVESPSSTPASLRIQTTPNPVVQVANITLATPQTGTVSLRVIDMLGRPVAILYDGVLGDGLHTFEWNAAGSPIGSYYLEAVSSQGTFVQRIELIK
ncbi:MAG TPA: T9SS type A sorting domain-containing protein, partial [Candidatus Kapabacteria bacterium]|nr:T9SS type A sorting domain-containing protein [Candidatus Kapabacteria bacterium]